MKALLTCSTAALFCLLALAQSSLGQPNDMICNGPWNGCGVSVYCFHDSGQCEDGGPAYEAYDQIGWDMYTCVKASEESCYNTIPVPECSYVYYQTWNMGVCSNKITNCEPQDSWGDVCQVSPPDAKPLPRVLGRDRHATKRSWLSLLSVQGGPQWGQCHLTIA